MPDVTALITDPSNADQLHAWDGDEGAFWTANADRFDRAVAAYQGEFLAAADIAETDHVLDIGCGTGQTTRDAARAASSGSALGVDLSSQMIALARRLAAAAGIRNARFEQADAQVHPFEPAAFDVAISRTGAMFFGDAIAAFTNIGRALRPAGGSRCSRGRRCRATSGSARSRLRWQPVGTFRCLHRTPDRSRSPTPTECTAC